MAKEQMRPASPQQAPDPATSYERNERKPAAGKAQVDNEAVPCDQADKLEQTVTHRQDPTRQINGEDVDHSMRDEEPLGEDQTPTEKTAPRNKRHPRTDGTGGTP